MRAHRKSHFAAGNVAKPKGRRRHGPPGAIAYLAAAALAGGALGIGSVTFNEAGASDLAVSLGLARARPPQPGDHWRGCNDARAAGTAPIYAGEPGYREDMDGDGDGIACEPHR